MCGSQKGTGKTNLGLGLTKRPLPPAWPETLATSRLGNKDSAGHPAPLHADSCPAAGAALQPAPSAPRPMHAAAFQGLSSSAAAAASCESDAHGPRPAGGSPGPLPLPGRPRGSVVSREAHALQVPAAAGALRNQLPPTQGSPSQSRGGDRGLRPGPSALGGGRAGGLF